MRSLFCVFLVLLLALLMGACATPVDPATPPEIVYGEDLCHRCGMIISDERFAAGLVAENDPGVYEHLIFDDIGEMVAFTQENAEINVVSYFVHDFHTREWMNAREAGFVVAAELHTPMGFGIAAFSDPAAARAEVEAWHGEFLDFETLLRGSSQAMPMGHGHGSR